MTKVAGLQEWDILPGVMPATDATGFDIPCYADSYHVRFDPSTGRPRKIGGWVSNIFDYGAEVVGTMRTIYSATINQKVYTILGTESYLYSLIGSTLTNISPLKTTTVSAPDSLSTHYDTLANNPLTTTNGSGYINVSDPEAERFIVGDRYTLSGASTTNGIPDTEINDTHIVRAIAPGLITILVSTSATSSGSGGGASVVRTSGLITVSSAAHGQVDADRVSIDNATDTGGILAAEINQEFQIRNVVPNAFDVMTSGEASSAVTAAGGAATEYYEQIDPGALNQGLSQGYGAGLYGAGLYGTALQSTLGETYPRIWFVDRFGDNLIMNPGNQSPVYAWAASNATAPAPVMNAPDDVNYAFVSDGILVTFGHDVENKIFASDQGNYTQWTASSTNQVFEDIIEGAGRFISHVPIDGSNLIFTEQQTYTFKYIGLPNVWQVKLLDASIGLIAPMARCSVNGIAYWMGQENFYMFRGGKPETIPSNIGPQASILRYVYNDLNYSQRFKIFMWYNEKFDELWIHYPSSQSSECDRIARLNRKLMVWMPDEMDRTAGEYPNINLSNPRLANASTLYTHESGTDDDGAPLAFSVKTKKFISGKDTAIVGVVIPDNTMSGTVSVALNAYNYPSSSTRQTFTEFDVTQDTELVQTPINGRFWDYTISGEELGQDWLMGQWMEEPQKGPTAK